MSTEPEPERVEHWSRHLFFVLACIGAAVGLGSIWRFPYMAYRNGGGAFLLPYILALGIVGLPLCLLEIGIGRWCGGSVVAAYRKSRPAFTWIGWWTLINSVLIVFYYCVVLAWCVQYFVYSFKTAWGGDPAAFFTQTVLHLSAGPLEIGGINWGTLIALAIVWLLILIIVRGGLPWISKALLITVPLPFILLIVMAVRGINLPGASDGVAYFLKPRFGDIWRPSVWAAATSQTVLALGLAMGQMVAYASRKKDDTGLTKSALWICASVLVISILAGIVIFAIMGFLANTKGSQIQDLKLESIFLAFVSYPMAISSLPVAPLWGMIFFGLLIAIGLDSAFAAIEATLPGTVEMSSGGSRKRLGTALCVIGFLGGIFFATHAGLYWLDIVDHWVEKYAMPSIIIIECILFAWLAPIDEIGHRLKVSWKAFPIRSWKILIRVVIPTLLFLVFGGRVIEEGLTAYQSYPAPILYVAGWGVFAAVIVISAAVAVYYNRRVTGRERSAAPSRLTKDLPMEEKKLELLADHYKDTHTIIRLREERRDRYFLLTVVVVGFLALVVLSPSSLQGILKQVEVSGAKIEVTSVPVAVMASVAWTLLLVFLLRCYQAATTIERQYNYLHDIEDQIAPELGNGTAFRREGRSYKEKKPVLTHWAWFLYTIILPVLLSGVTIHLLCVERQASSSWNWRYDRYLGAAVVFTLLAYVIPQIVRRIKHLADACIKKAEQDGPKPSP